MGVDFNAGIFYGAKINLEDKDEWDFPDEFNEKNELLEIGNINPYGEPIHIIYIKSSWKMTDDTSDSVFIKFKDLQFDTHEWDECMADACEKYDLSFDNPDWHFVSYYS